MVSSEHYQAAVHQERHILMSKLHIFTFYYFLIQRELTNGNNIIVTDRTTINSKILHCYTTVEYRIYNIINIAAFKDVFQI